MELQAVLLLLLACRSLSKENLPQIRAMPGVNSRKVITREARPFYCTNTTKDSTTSRKLPMTSDSALNQPKSQSTNDRPATVPSTIQQTTRPATNQPNHNSQSSSDSPTTIKMIEITTKKLRSTPLQSAEMLSTRMKSQLNNSGTETAQSPMKQITNLPNHYNFTAESPISPSPTDREFTSDQQTTKQLRSTLHTPQPERDLISTPPTTPPRQELPFDLNTTSHECHFREEGQEIRDAETYVNKNCTKKCTCNKNDLSCESYKCSLSAECREKYGVGQCYCNDGYVGDGETCNKPYRDCYEAYQNGTVHDGALFILPKDWPGPAFNVWCNMTTSGGGWTVLQRRPKGGGFVGKKWKHYKQGFGSISGNHWLGNEKIFYLTSQRNYTLRVDLVFSKKSTTYQEYSLFKIANSSDNYRLVKLGNTNGTAGDGMDGLLGQQFSTKDRDNDGNDGIDCSKEHAGRGWWYSNKWSNKSCTTDELGCFNHSSSDCKMRCTKANLNGIYGRCEVHTGIFWNSFHSITSTEMKIRPANTTEDTI